MISRREADRLRDQLLAVLDEDAHNTRRLVSRLESITQETGVGAHAALLLILTHLPFEEEQARAHWEAILAHREEMSRALGRDAGVRTAVLDYFTNVNRRLLDPALIDLKMHEAADHSGTDGLTGLFTDRRFRSVLQSEIRRARRYSQKAAVIVADIDGFARTNERFGALVADRLLRELAILLNNNVRDIDSAGRPGEDELAVLLPETDRNGALLVAERFRREVESCFARRESGGQPVELTVSAGVACYPDDATTPETLLERAAQALYQAKAAGRNTVHLYHPERRRYLRFDLEPGRFEVEVLAPAFGGAGRAQDLSRNGILFSSPEPLEIGEQIEIRVIDAGELSGVARPLCIRGRVVRLEELPGEQTAELYEVGVALDLEWAAGTEDLIQFLEKARGRTLGRQP